MDGNYHNYPVSYRHLVIVLTTMLLLYWNIYLLLDAIKHHLREIITNKLHVVRA
jgi:hypothetical protein